MTHQEILHQARQAGVMLVRFLYCGNDSVIRGKTTHIDHLERRLTEGIGLTVAMQSFMMLDQLVPEGHFGPVGEIRLLPDPASFAILSYAPRQARLFCNMMQLDHHPWAMCPRYFLQRMLAQATAQGYHLHSAFENEFYLARQSDDQRLPYDTSRCFSSIGMDSAGAVMVDIIDALTAQGVQVEQYYPELGPGQQELSVRHTSGLRAADNQLAFRDTVRGVARQHGLLASLAPKPFADQAGNGSHIHFSLWNEGGDQNLFYDPDDPAQLSPVGYHFTAGVLAHLPALLALTAPSVNSYRRLQPRFWSSAYTCYGPDNREAAVRIASPFWQQEMASINLELKPCDPSCNPYLALGGLLAAGLDGIARQLHPGAPLLQDPAALSDDERRQRHINRLPKSLDAALDALQADAVLTSALGSELAQEYVIVKRAEAAAFRDQDLAFELAQHFHAY
ncbi:Glutamine synthetase [Candidatus Entotheonellaceae bacterium PAL068K]